MNRTVQIGGSLVLLSFLFTVAYGIEGVWIGRSLMALVVAGSGLVLTLPLAVTLGVFVIPADLMLIARSPHSLDMLIWAGFVAAPFLINRYVYSAPESGSPPSEPQPESGTVQTEENSETIEFHPEVAESDDASDQLQEILVSRLETARERFGFDNLVYFHVRNNEAKPGYVINNYGDIKTDFKVGTDRARGVGWVLRHKEPLTQDGKQVDWRNLQYHRTPVNPDRVIMKPFSVKQDLIGIMVLEWDELDGDVPGELERFLGELENLMRVDRAVRQMERREKEVDLMRKVADVQPLEHDRLETIYQRLTDLIRDLIPADNVEFFTDDGEGTDDTVVKQRRLFYEKCCEWMRSGKAMLRINQIANFSYQGKRIQKLAPPDVESFLGGVLEDDEGILGYLCLDDQQEGFFTSDDEQLLKLLLERMSGLVRLAKQHETVKQQRDSFRDWIDRIRTVSRTADPETTMERIVDALMETFSPLGVAIYWTVNGDFRLQKTSEGINPSGHLAKDSPLIRRLKDNSGQQLVEFPRIQRLTSYEPPVGADLLKVFPIRDEGDLIGFVTLYFGEEPSERVDDFLEEGLPLLTQNLEFSHRYASLKVKHRRDDVTSFPKYDVWKRSLNQKLNDESDRDLVVWRLVVPQFESIVENRGLKRAQQWASSLANRIKKDFATQEITRFHGTDFGGFSFISSGEISTILSDLRRDIADWSFPTGRWPNSPRTGYEEFHAPFPDVEAMIEAARRDLLNRKGSEDQGKETALDSV